MTQKSCRSVVIVKFAYGLAKVTTGLEGWCFLQFLVYVSMSSAYGGSAESMRTACLHVKTPPAKG